MLPIFFFTDFGVDNLEELIESTSAVWLLSNVTDKMTSQPLAGKTHTIIDWEGHKVLYCNTVHFCRRSDHVVSCRLDCWV